MSETHEPPPNYVLKSTIDAELLEEQHPTSVRMLLRLFFTQDDYSYVDHMYLDGKVNPTMIHTAVQYIVTRLLSDYSTVVK